jgi:predicted heme/steroid binding protein
MEVGASTGRGVHRGRAVCVLLVALFVGFYRQQFADVGIFALKALGVFISTGRVPSMSAFVPRFLAPKERTFTLKELSAFDGSVNSPSRQNPPGPNGEGDVYLSIGGIVFDVTEQGRQFYGVGQHYHCFAASPVSRALTLGSLEIPDIELGDNIEDFTEKQIEDLRQQVAFYSGK